MLRTSRLDNIFRAKSPRVSEAEVDISSAIVDQDGGQQYPDSGLCRMGMKAATFLNSDAQNGGDADADGVYIAAQQAASHRKAASLKGRTVKRGGGFQAMGLNPNLLKAITRKGFSVPTPIQRKTIPLLLEGQDVVGMARTGSGKTAAFVVPMIETLKAHSAQVGARALILSPSRELALQTLKVVKEFGRGTDLRCILLIGGDSLEDQFSWMTENPDIVIATPGRFLHLKIEMSLDLSSMRYVVFDEADRLFEMGFAAQLTEILHALPQPRQTLLFSATLPKSLVEFARAGLQEPTLVRLDGESKISPDLESAYFTVKSAEKDGALLHILHDVVKVPAGAPKDTASAMELTGRHSQKRKRGTEANSQVDMLSSHSTIVFAATKHHVDYLAALLTQSGFAVSYVYGSLDQAARKMQVENFRSGKTSILVVTDVAARGIDIPILANVINYDFPSQPKIFVHRVGRTARAGRRGRSLSLLQAADAPYLLDLQLFLGRRLILGGSVNGEVNFAEDIVVGGLARGQMERNCEWVNKMLNEDIDLAALRSVADRGERLYRRTRNPASSESAKRSKDVVSSPKWSMLNPMFDSYMTLSDKETDRMLARVSGFRPHETVFEIGKRSNGTWVGHVVRKQRHRIESRRKEELAKQQIGLDLDSSVGDSQDRVEADAASSVDIGLTGTIWQQRGEESLELTSKGLESEKENMAEQTWMDNEIFMSYLPKTSDPAVDRAYGVHTGSYNPASNGPSFVEATRGATMELKSDETHKSFAEPSKVRGMRWDKKQKKYVAKVNDEDGSRGRKMITGESGQKIAASYRSGRFEAWRRTNKMHRVPRVGEVETVQNRALVGPGRTFKHKLQKAPKDVDRFRDDYHSRKKRVAKAKENRLGKYKDSGAKGELRGLEDVRKQREIKNRRRAKNARPSKRSVF